MSLKIRIISLLLVILTCISFAACNKQDGSDDDDTPGDEFSGSISDKEDEDTDSEDETPEDAGDPDSVTTITTAEQLRAMKRKGTYILGADIDLGGTAWTPIGTYGAPFEGTFDGAGHKITGLKVNSAEADSGISLSYQYLYYGFFGVTNGATVKDVKFDNAEINADTTEVYNTVYSGILAGLMLDTEVSGCELSGNVSAVSSNSIAAAGALAGMVKDSDIMSCNSSAVIKTDRSPIRAISGGLIGHARPGTKISDCTVTTSITAISTIGNAYAGGIVGYCHSTELTRCFSDSEIYAEVTLASPETGAKGAAHAAGIAAISTADSEDEMSVFTKCYSSTKKIRAYSIENAVYACGITTDSDYTKYIDCFSYAALEAESVNDTAYSAGLFGTITALCTVERSFFAGSIKVDSQTRTVGTLCVTNHDEEDAKKVFISASYKSDTAFVLNGVSYTKAQNKDILVQGTSRQSNVFLNLALLCDAMGWDPNEWEIKNGQLSLKRS